MMRSSSLPLHEPDNLSSPDPLANSSSDRLPVATRSPTRSPSPPKRRLSSPAKTSRSKRNFHEPSSPLSTYGFVPPPISPSRTVTEQTLSPWKIRVTVEAEHEDGDEAGGTMTRTIKVPLREESSPLNSEHATGRGRRSAPASAKTKRSGTPVRRRSGSRSRSRRQSVTDLNIAPLGDDGDSDEWMAKKRSSRKKRPSRSKQTEPEQSVDAPFEIHEDVDDGVDVGPEEPSFQPSLGHSQSPELRQIDLNRVSVRPRAQPTKGKEGRAEWSDMIPGSEPGFQVSATKTGRKVSTTSAASYPTPSPTSSHPNSDEVEKEPTQEQEHYDTILESEGFTMIDLDSIPSTRQFRVSPEGQKPRHEQPDEECSGAAVNDSRTPESKTMPASSSPKKPTPIPAYLTIADDDESELSSNVPSSPPAAETSLLAVPTRPLRSSDRKVTPDIYSSPSLPPPPPAHKVTSTNDRCDSLPKQVLNAGMALQGVVTSPESDHSASTQTSQVAGPGKGDFFNGFSSSTTRELRAGLRFGEELAKRPRPGPSSSEVVDNRSATDRRQRHDKVDLPKMKPQPTTQVWRGEAIVQHSPFTTETSSETKKSDRTRSSQATTENTSLSSTRSTAKRLSSRFAGANTQMFKLVSSEADIARLSTAARREHEWQLEREAVSRKIDNAGPDKVVVLDGDDDENLPDMARSSPSYESVEQDQRAKIHHGVRSDHEEVRHLHRTRGEADHSCLQAGNQDKEIVWNSSAGNSIEVEDDEDEDIWLQEAKDESSSPRDQDTAGMFTRTEQRRQRERAAEVVNKPRRSMIPSPWKRGEHVAEASALMSDGALSGIFWQQPPAPQDAIKFGAGEIARQKRSISGNFDLDTMLSSPVKVATVGRKNLTLRKSDGHEERKRGSSDEAEKGEIEDTESQTEDVYEAEESQQDMSDAAESLSSSASSPPQPQTIPVNFNDSTLSTAAGTPPRQTRPSPKETAENSRLTPPRSAMKGARHSLSPVKPEVQSEIRKVVFSERSLYLNSDGDESSMSANLESPLAEPKSHPQFQLMGLDEEIELAEQNQNPGSKWLSWVCKSKTGESTRTTEQSTPSMPKVDGASDIQPSNQIDGGFDVEGDGEEESGQWQSVKVSLPTNGTNGTTRTKIDHPLTQTPLNNTEPRNQPQPRGQPTSKPTSTKTKLPSYLLPPSYPSDPTRPPAEPLSVSGSFTNTHFRTLHIIHAKSQRPRFHAPKRVRRSIREMIGWKMEVDESGNLSKTGGEGEVFEWTLGQKEAEVMERFMQEVEFGYVDNGVDVGNTGRLRWGWEIEELARWLGMVVVGEAVRSEEGAKR